MPTDILVRSNRMQRPSAYANIPIRRDQQGVATSSHANSCWAWFPDYHGGDGFITRVKSDKQGENACHNKLQVVPRLRS